MKVFNVFEAYTNSDTIEGRGCDIHIGYFIFEEDAKNAGIGKGVMGSAAYVRPITIEIFDSLKEYEVRQNHELRLRALAKLSKEERKALGLE